MVACSVGQLALCAPLTITSLHPKENVFKNFFQLYRCRNFDFLIPDAPELIANFLDGEQDASCKRNAFMMLIHADQVKAKLKKKHETAHTELFRFHIDLLLFC